MSVNLIRNPILQATLAGLGAMALYSAYALSDGAAAAGGGHVDKQQTAAEVLMNLKRELRSKFSSEPPRSEDGLLTLEFMVGMHTLLYKYK
jgi:hypothetical protein